MWILQGAIQEYNILLDPRQGIDNNWVEKQVKNKQCSIVYDWVKPFSFHNMFILTDSPYINTTVETESVFSTLLDP